MKRRSKKLVLEGWWLAEDELFDTTLEGIPVRLSWGDVLAQLTDAGPHVQVRVRVANTDTNADPWGSVELEFHHAYHGAVIDAACHSLQQNQEEDNLNVVIWATWQEEA